MRTTCQNTRLTLTRKKPGREAQRARERDTVPSLWKETQRERGREGEVQSLWKETRTKILLNAPFPRFEPGQDLVLVLYQPKSRRGSNQSKAYDLLHQSVEPRFEPRFNFASGGSKVVKSVGFYWTGPLSLGLSLGSNCVPEKLNSVQSI